MKKNILFLIVVMTIVNYGHGQKKNADLYSGYVRYSETSVPGTVSVISTGFGKKRAESIRDAFNEAFYAVLFRGIPGSHYELPMIANESEKKNDPVVKALLNDGYSSFVISSSSEGEEKKVRKNDGAKGVMTTNIITINYDALRRHLENNGVIRKFGI